MTKVDGQINTYDYSMLDAFPSWKRDLMLRKRTNPQNNITGNNYNSKSYNANCNISVNNKSIQAYPNQLTQCSVRGPTSSSSVVQGDSVHLNQFENVICGVKLRPTDKKIIKNDCNEMKSETSMNIKGCRSPESGVHEGDFTYGPGFVSKLKDRYMSLALRESKAYLRKYISLEDLLEEPPQRGRAPYKNSSKGDSSQSKDYMKRARSMDSLAMRRTGMRAGEDVQPSSGPVNSSVPKSQSSVTLKDALVKKDVIIIENNSFKSSKSSTHSKTSKNPGVQSLGSKVVNQPQDSAFLDYPAPDIVKQVKQIFEETTQPHEPTANNVQNTSMGRNLQKPPLKAKPPGLKDRKLPTQPLIGRISDSNVKLTPISASVSQPRVGRVSENQYQGEKHSRLHSPPTALPSSPTPVHKNVIQSDSLSMFGFSDEEKGNGFEVRRNGNSHIPFHSSEDTNLISPTDSKEIQRINAENNKNIEKSNQEVPLPPPKVTPVPLQFTDILSNTTSSPPPLPPRNGRVSHPQDNNNYTSNSLSQKKQMDIYISSKTNSSNKPSSKPLKNSQISDAVPEKSSEIMNLKTSSISDVIKAAESKRSLKKEVHKTEQIVNNKEKLCNTSPSYCKSNSLIQNQNKTSESPKTPTKSPTKGKSPSKSPSPGGHSSLVFNFSKRTDTPDYIENDGIDLSKRLVKLEPGYVIMPGYDGKLDSSTDGDDDGGDTADSSRGGGTPPPCNIVFEGEGVIIKGISNLQRQPKTKKLEVSFDMGSTSTFEYPSEDRLLTDSAEAPKVYSQGLTLSDYTPSKLSPDQTFELGISRTHSKKMQGSLAVQESTGAEDGPQYARPAGEAETIPWSSDNAPDMLF